MKNLDVKTFMNTITSVDDLKRMRNQKRGPERKVLNQMIRKVKDTAWNMYFASKHKLAADFMEAREAKETTKRKKDISKTESNERIAYSTLIRFFSVPMIIMDYVNPKE